MAQLVDGRRYHAPTDRVRKLDEAILRQWTTAALDIRQGALRNPEMLGELPLRQAGGFAGIGERFHTTNMGNAHKIVKMPIDCLLI